MTNPKVKRFGFYIRPSDGSHQFHEVDDGAYVRFEDYERLREVLTIPNITPETTSAAMFIRTLSEHEKGQPVNTQDLINALAWRVRNQKREIARLHATMRKLVE